MATIWIPEFIIELAFGISRYTDHLFLRLTADELLRYPRNTWKTKNGDLARKLSCQRKILTLSRLTVFGNPFFSCNLARLHISLLRPSDRPLLLVYRYSRSTLLLFVRWGVVPGRRQAPTPYKVSLTLRRHLCSAMS
jgi:hypothetical protein